MGFQSWECVGCGKSMLSPDATNDKNRWMSDVVVYEPLEQRQITGTYDGYGRVNGDILATDPGWPWAGKEPCCWHRSCWQVAGEPEISRQSSRSEDQGWFFLPEEYDHADPQTTQGGTEK